MVKTFEQPLMVSGANMDSLLPEAIKMTLPLFDLITMLFYYSKRVLMNQSDNLRAMAGILRRFSEKDEIPVSLWTSYGAV